MRLIDAATPVTLIPLFVSSIVTFWICPSGGSRFCGRSSTLTQNIYPGINRSE
jgi:hypothetical protein